MTSSEGQAAYTAADEAAQRRRELIGSFHTDEVERQTKLSLLSVSGVQYEAPAAPSIQSAAELTE